MLTSSTTRYEMLVRYDETGAFKGGHRIDITRFVDSEGGVVPAPIITEAQPLTRKDVAEYLKQTSADALADYSALKGSEIAQRVQIEDLTRQLHETAAATVEMQDALVLQIQAREAEITRLRKMIGYDDVPSTEGGAL